LVEVSNDSLLATFSNEHFGLTVNVRKNGAVFEIVVIDDIFGDQVLSIHPATLDEAEQFAEAMIKPAPAPSAVLLRSA